MSRHLYEEALADVKQVKEAAEADVKRALIETLAPRIGRLVEGELMKDLDEDSDDGDEECDKKDVLVDDTDSVAEATEVIDGEGEDVEPGESQPNVKPDSSHMTPADILTNENVDEKIEGFESDASMYENTSRRIRESKSFFDAISRKISELDDSYGYIQENVSDLEKKTMYENRLESVFQRLTTIQETVKKMGKKLIKEEDVTLKLTGLPDDLDLENIGIDLISGTDDEDASDEDSGEDAEAGSDEDLDFDFGGDEGSEDAGDEGEEEPALEGFDGMDDDTVVEVDEEMLQNEIARIKANSLTEESADLPANIVDDFGDGTKKGDPLDVDVDTADNTPMFESARSIKRASLQRSRQRFNRLRNKLVEARKAGNKKIENVIISEMKRTHQRIVETRALLEGKKSAVRTATNVRKNVVNENRATQSLTEQAEVKKLRKKLEENNLSLAKLEYANKLLQTDGLSTKQKASAIARLDEAKSIRDVKLVYDSITKTFSKKRTVTESVHRTLGSSSGVIRSAAPVLTEGSIDVEKWQRMAGIK